MTRRIAPLRSVNARGGNSLPMRTLVSILESLGCVGVRTYIQSGNAVFDGVAAPNDISARIEAHFGFRPHVFVLSAASLKKAAACCPFAREASAAPKSVHVFFLESVPATGAVADLGALKARREDFAVAGSSSASIRLGPSTSLKSPTR